MAAATEQRQRWWRKKLATTTAQDKHSKKGDRERDSGVLYRNAAANTGRASPPIEAGGIHQCRLFNVDDPGTFVG